MTVTDWRYHFEVDPDLDADDKKFQRWKAQGLRLTQDRPKTTKGLIIAVLVALALVSMAFLATR